MHGIVDVHDKERMRSRGSRQSALLGDAELVERARLGDVDAWSDIVQLLGPRVQGYARGKGITDAEDVVQDVFMAAAERIGDFDGDWRSFRSWIFSIAYRQIVNRYRAPGREDTELPPALPDPASTPDDQVVARETASEAVEALGRLTDAERDVVLLRVVAGLDTDEVAAAVSKRPGNVRVIQSRALRKVRAELTRRGYDEVWGATVS
jgi:RNA polymerase sigma-70 factor (ECF subfamily)